MRPLLGLENSNLKSSTGDGPSNMDEDDDDGMTNVSNRNAQAALLKALQGINSRTEEDEEDAAMDAVCRLPGGACALPPKKTKATAVQPPTAATTESTSSSLASTDSAQ